MWHVLFLFVLLTASFIESRSTQSMHMLTYVRRRVKETLHDERIFDRFRDLRPAVMKSAFRGKKKKREKR
ncbi:hypothetical protein PUN28_000285 [Cardiocondyla obscurior]|uniref:Uncharacterized protein n=1 Tax=Cardiocondyla obscurior TaxID=286306 RepID=A0AAW2GYP6_9HYME